MREPLPVQDIRLPSRLLRGAREACRSALGLLYPPTCIACQGATGEAHALCAACWSGIRLIERPFCERLGTPFQVDLGQPLLPPSPIRRSSDAPGRWPSTTGSPAFWCIA